MPLSERHMEAVRMSQKRKKKDWTGEERQETRKDTALTVLLCVRVCVSGDIKEDKYGATKVY